nr:hypothetical protein [Tanacetum cinerariifolium]
NSIDCPPDSYHPPHPTFETYSGDTCGNDSHFGYDCSPQFPLNYELEPGYIQNYNLIHTIHRVFHNNILVVKITVLLMNLIKAKKKRIEEEQAAKAQNRKLPVCYDDDDDEEESNSLKDNIIYELPPCSAVTPSEPIDSLKSMLNRDSSIISSSSKIDSLLDEFTGELTLLKSILPRIDKTDCHPENEIRLSQRLLYDNSSPRPPKEFNSKNSNAEIVSFSPSPIPNEDSDSFMEKINLFLTPDDPMPPSIEDDDDSEGDILFLERLLHDDPIPLSDTLDFSYEVRVFLPFFTYPVTSPVLLSSRSEDTIFYPGITVNRFYSF